MNPRLYEKQAKSIPRMVFFNASTALKQGMGVCWQRDYGTAAEADQYRDTYVQLPSTSNNKTFAGVVTQDYSAKSGGQWIEIFEPGSVCLVAGSRDVTIGNYITCIAGGPDAGRFADPGFLGRGTARVLQTKSDVVLDADFTGAAAFDTTGKILTDSGADFIATSGIVVGDTLVVFGGEDDGTDSVTPQSATITAVAATTLTVGTAISTTGGTMQASYYVIRQNPKVLVELLDGEESGLVEYVSPPSPGTTVATDDFSVMNGGKTFITGGYAIATANSTTTLADGKYLGQKKAIQCLGALTTSDARVILATAGIQRRVKDIVGGTTGNTDGNPLALASADFDAANELLVLEWSGAWVEKYHTGCALNAA